jgi:DNA helicase-2/ATP-dependent DNA helicase PcrA
LRDFADQIGLEASFTIRDREDSADLMNLVRHELGFSKTKSRFPMKGTCLAIYSRSVNAELAIEEVLKTSFSMVRRLGGRAAHPLRSLCRGEAAAERPRLR